ncbi:MAG: lysostaphin resistance A-like protein [Promethearchaeota archaeon]
MRKFTIIIVFTSILIIPPFFDVYPDFLAVKSIKLQEILFIILGCLLLFLIGLFINFFGFNQADIENMRNHTVIEALINKNNVILWIFFPVTMLMEELLFRYYILSFLSSTLEFTILLSVLISSIAFSLYHIHTWFTFKSQKILFVNLSYTFILGLILGYVFFMSGIIPCILIHYLVAFNLYYIIYKKNFKQVDKNKIEFL